MASLTAGSDLEGFLTQRLVPDEHTAAAGKCTQGWAVTAAKFAATRQNFVCPSPTYHHQSEDWLPQTLNFTPVKPRKGGWISSCVSRRDLQGVCSVTQSIERMHRFKDNLPHELNSGAPKGLSGFFPNHAFRRGMENLRKTLLNMYLEQLFLLCEK